METVCKDLKMREKFVVGEIYHVFNKSIANYGIFKDLSNSQRFIETLDFYNNVLIINSFSKFLRSGNYRYKNLLYLKQTSIIKFITYCLMSDHYHLLIKILKDNFLSKYINDIENSFTRYFNIKFNRKGPLWQSAFKAVRITSNEQLLHVSRYIHLNPTTARLVDHPEDWQFSSYRDFIGNENILKENIKEISIRNVLSYKKFIENNKDYQRKLRIIKKLTLE